MADEVKRIKKIKLSNNQVYSIFDEGAIRPNKRPDGSKEYPDLDDEVLITGNGIVDKVIIKGHVSIVEIDDVPITDSISNVLVQDTTSGAIKKRSTDQLLEDIGGISYSMNDSSGTLSLKFGRQPKESD